MKKKWICLLVLCFMAALMTGCGVTGNKMNDVTVIYDVTVIASFLLLIGYCCLVKKKDIWFLLLFSSIFIINAGYLTLSLSKTLGEALLANRVAYLGSVFLPMTMLMITSNVCGIKHRRWLSATLLGIAVAVFLIAASPGYFDVYYSSVSLEFINGAAVLKKIYGPWHCIYLYYLVLYFLAMVGLVVHAFIKRRMATAIQAVFLAGAVFVNMGVWLIEQIIRIDIELLSLSYIISGLFLLALCLLMQESLRTAAQSAEAAETPADVQGDLALQEAMPDRVPEDIPDEQPDAAETRLEYFVSQIPRLTPTERIIFDLYIEGKSTKEIMAELQIKENTLKYHNKNIYGKLGVSSRKQLVEIASMMKNT